MDIDYFNTEHVKSGLKKRALKGASVTVLAQIAAFIIQTIGTVIVARLIAPNDFGLVAMVLSISLLLQSFGCNGFVEAVIQRDEINHRQISTLFWINAGFSLVWALLFIASAPLIAWFYNEPLLKPIVAVMSASIFFGGLSNQHVSLLVRNMQFVKSTSNELISSFTSVIVSIVMALFGLGYWSLVAKWVMAPLMIALGAWVMCGWRPGLPSRGTGVRPILKFAFLTYGNFILSYCRRNIDKMLTGRFSGSQQLGYYDRAYHLSSMLPVQIISPLNSVSIATFSRLKSDSEKFRRSYLKVLSILAFVGMPLSACLTVVSQDVILLLLGPQWGPAGKIFFAFSLSIGITIIYITHGWLHLSLGTPDRWFRWGIVEFTVTVLCFAAGAPFGPFGVALAFSISFYMLIGPALWYAGKPIQLKIASVLSCLWKYYLAALLAGITSWIVLHVNGFTAGIFLGFNVIVRIATALILCLPLYLVFIIILFRGVQPITQFVTLLREIIVKDEIKVIS